LLLCGDAVYAALDNLSLPPLPVAALATDVIARGLTSRWPTTTPLLNHGDFVDLCVQHDKSLSWS
jgi:sulfur relay protein TusB/DsrH